MKYVLGIDFGSAYTKVALRPDPDKASILLEHSGEMTITDRKKICVPTLVSTDTRGRYYCGTKIPPGHFRRSDVTIHRNWKAHLFSAALSTDGPQLSVEDDSIDVKNDFLNRLDSAATEKRRLLRVIAVAKDLEVEDVVAIAAADRLTLAQLRVIAKELTSRATQNDAPIPVSSRESGRKNGKTANGDVTSLDIKNVALEFFKWLRQFTMEACERHGVLNLDTAPARVCVPAFDQSRLAVSVSLLLEILEESGWKLDPNHPTVSEPFSNAIGALTRGTNRTWKPINGLKKEFINTRDMFNFNGLVEAYRERSLGHRRKWADYSIFVVDMGAYTTDFAIVRFDLDDVDLPPRVFACSDELGVRNMEETVLTAHQRRGTASLPPKDLERLRVQVYSQNRFFQEGDLEIGVGSELAKIRESISEFGRQVAFRAQQFLKDNDVKTVDELILTGGGMNMPLVKTAIFNGLKSHKVALTHWPQDAPSGNGFYKLDEYMTRGGSALGSASIFFDYLA